jgi:protein-tyrosine phosphatase
MIDLHCHLLPGVDDGPRTMAEAVALCRLSVENGIRRAVATPHFLAITRKSTWDNIQSILAALQAELAAQAIALHVTVAAEVRICGELVSLIPTGKVPFIGQLDGKPVLLLEFPHTSSLPFGSEKLVKWLVAQNIRPMIAHPERNKTFQREPESLTPFLRAGCLLQVTAGSLTGEFGPEAARTARALLDEDRISIVATDAHDTEERPPSMRAGFDFVARQAGEATAWRLMRDTPQTILES